MTRWTGSKRRRRVRDKLMEAQRGRCAYCAGTMRYSDYSGDNDPNIATFDHVTPLSKGGSPGTNNIVLACLRCNSAKGNSVLRDRSGATS